MYNIKKHRITLNLAITAFVILCFILASILWNISISEAELKYSGYIILLIFLIILSGLFIYYTAFKFHNQEKFDEYIGNIKKEERIKVLEELKKADNEEVNETEKINLHELVNSLIPDMRGVKNVNTFSEKLLLNLSSYLEIVQGICYIAEKKSFIVSAKYALTDDLPVTGFKPGDTLPGQAVKNKEIMMINDIPENYFKAESGLGKSKPKHLIFLPVFNENEPIALLELATFKQPDQTHTDLLNFLKDSELGERFLKLKKNKEGV